MTPTEIIETMDTLFNSGDPDNVNTIMGFYAPDAKVFIKPNEFIDKTALREMMLAYIKLNATTKQLEHSCVYYDDVALYMSKWNSTLKEGKSTDAIATVVFTKNGSGEWKISIDNSFGPLYSL